MPEPTDPKPPADPVALLAAALARVADLAGEGAGVVPEALTADQAATLCGVGKSEWFDLNSRGLVPAPVEIGDGGRCPRWLGGELLAWLRAGAPSRARWALMRDQLLRRAG